MQGNVVGGGLALALACDLRFCAADAYLAITPARLGLVYGHAETRRLVELVGPSRAKDLLFTGRRIETDEALAIGLIDRRIETALHETALGYARGLADLSQASIRGAQARGRRDRRPASPSRPRPSARLPNRRRSGPISPKGARPSPRSGRRNSPSAARRRPFPAADGTVRKPARDAASPRDARARGLSSPASSMQSQAAAGF